MIDRADLACRIQARLTPADTDDLLRKPPLAQRQSNRPSDQTNADNGYRVVLDHAGILKTNRPSDEGVHRMLRIA